MTVVTLDNSGKALSVCWLHSQYPRQQAIKLGEVQIRAIKQSRTWGKTLI